MRDVGVGSSKEQTSSEMDADRRGKQASFLESGWGSLMASLLTSKPSVTQGHLS